MAAACTTTRCGSRRPSSTRSGSAPSPTAPGPAPGDLNGLVGKFDYLAWLGIDCIWIPPFFPTPERDGGYDVEFMTGIQVQLGTHQGMQQLIEQAHARGIRVISDFVVNHTSADHPWFQASREDPEGPYGDYYVWRDDDTAYADARIIFVDTEESNWTFDPVRKQFYWHRFYSHQPDLNYDNPKVLEEVLNALRFWLDLGVDGFRLDAVPYLVEEEGTNCENLPGTHEILKRIRAMIDEEYPGRLILAEANQWPRRPSSTSATGTRCTWRSTSPSCPACSWRSSRDRASRSARSSPTPRRSPTAASGRPSCATTTSSPSRW